MDKISNLIISIKNAGAVKKESVVIPYSNFKMEIVELLKREGFIKSVSKKGKKIKKNIEIKILYKKDGSPRVSDVKRISKSSKKIYMGVKDIRIVNGGQGILVISTPKGVITGQQARKANVGGEALFKIW